MYISHILTYTVYIFSCFFKSDGKIHRNEQKLENTGAQNWSKQTHN